MVTSPRNAAIDHYKLFLIACVVFGHCLQPSIILFEVRPVFHIIYLFHMPAFVFLSGMFTNIHKSRERALQFLILLVIFQFIYYFFAPLTGEDTHNILRPYWILWYLLCLIVWTLLSPVLAKIKFVLPISIVLALGAGCIDQFGYTLSLSRLFYFLPFFVAGLCYGEKIVSMVRSRAIAIFTLCLCIVLMAVTSGMLDERWLYGSFSYAKLGVSDMQGIAMRSGIMILSSVAALSLIPLMPSRESRLSAMGAHTLGVFLLHNFIVLPLWPTLDNLFGQSIMAGFAASFILSAVLVWILARAFFTRALMWPTRIVRSRRTD